ncbi:MAG: MerR family transcriptional regulator [Acidimicrobiia bacterium]
MRISELSAVSGVSTPTIKFYLREGLLHAGERTSATQAVYDETHVHRLRLIRVLREVGELSVDAIRDVLVAVDAETGTVHQMLEAASRALGKTLPSGGGEGGADPRVESVIASRGWVVGPDAPGRAHLASALRALDRLGAPVGEETLAYYADTADHVAAVELSFIDGTASRSGIVEQVVVGTVVFEQVLVAMRRLAEEHHSALRFG